jgi:hypothetical protein
MTRFKIVIMLILTFIGYCLKYRAAPWKYFQLNARFFNKEKGIFSKLDIDKRIPEDWRLSQSEMTMVKKPASFPVFLKPEWGQNAYGIIRVDSEEDYQRFYDRLSNQQKPRYLVQQAAWGGYEYEVFYIRDSENPSKFAIMSITEVCNIVEETFPINSVLNENTCYRDKTHDFKDSEFKTLWQHLKRMGDYKIARASLSADSKDDLLKGVFQIIEINIYVPFPLNLLDSTKSWKSKRRFIDLSMDYLAKNVGNISTHRKPESIFLKKLLMHYRIKA